MERILQVKRILQACLAALIAMVLFILPICYIVGEDHCIVDKGFALAYVDQYGFVHDDVYWLVVERENKLLTVFVNPRTWHRYSTGEKYAGSMNNFIVYEGDDSIARYLEGKTHGDTFDIGRHDGVVGP